ncbi:MULTISPECIES: NAD(P)/FAD-dependent oxidoreductase [Nocardia]|uniref:NAD(P)/FAD-dependent oxidoreductase n=1 Tax=Nocardia TaxID=1817 RepID=UPI0007EA4BE8|nr:MULTISPECIES: FAD-dependent oxidoreductase [Nocardia]MBF6277985.1 FAD-dependent oxidoreductase [Nocardia nova]OBA55469.1 ferredoxin reductase [Nocardia sp. 852002-51101_SCH5132738]OBB49736.1 ferredoxin reductase [Nocardia sp. 852002-51244_SCH5132740]OBF66881.1 ferredoxin reductase [Mycobacterium sp. 852002-51759_SCH5129042]
MTESQDGTDVQAPPHSVVVVGAAHAGVQLADRLRAGGYTGELTLISDEPHLPYQRPPLSKAWLKGEATGDSVLLREPDYYRDQKIELIVGARVTHLSRTPAGVEVRLTHDGENSIREFDRLVLATGARPRRLPLPGADHPDVLVLRDLDDARLLAARVPAGPVVVVGGGFVGLEVAATARALGADVTVIEAGERLLARAVGADTAEALLAAHRMMATEVVLVALPVSIEHRDNRIHAVRLADGREIPAATVVVGIGAEARTELAEQLGLDCDGGILVDRHCLASDGWTLAIGDCATHVSESGARYRLESVDNAVEQANAAAAVLLGQPCPQRPTPWFWSDQGDQKLQIAGLIGGHTSMLVRTDPQRPHRRVALYFTDDALTAAECLNSPADFVALRSALSRGHRPGPNDLADTAVPLKKLLAPARS